MRILLNVRPKVHILFSIIFRSEFVTIWVETKRWQGGGGQKSAFLRYKNRLRQLLNNFRNLISSWGLLCDHYWRGGTCEIHDFRVFLRLSRWFYEIFFGSKILSSSCDEHVMIMGALVTIETRIILTTLEIFASCLFVVWTFTCSKRFFHDMFICCLFQPFSSTRTVGRAWKSR